jgi:hypothetical protein
MKSVGINYAALTVSKSLLVETPVHLERLVFAFDISIQRKSIEWVSSKPAIERTGQHAYSCPCTSLFLIQR